jgi:hypothetical protein
MKVYILSDLYKEFPELLVQKNIIECNEGLCNTILEMLGAIKLYQDANLNKYDLTPTIFKSIKSRHGWLDIEYVGGDEVIEHIVNFTRRLSFKTCDLCGKIGNLYCSTKWMHWSNKRTLCTTHAVELYYYTLS